MKLCERGSRAVPMSEYMVAARHLYRATAGRGRAAACRALEQAMAGSVAGHAVP
jgi:hypothetical protein